MCLAAWIDGVALGEEEARSLWARFSVWMEAHRGDLAGFAAAEGFVSVHPGVKDGKPVLLASRREAQKPYGPPLLVEGAPGGSKPRHRPSGRPSGSTAHREQSTKKRGS